MMVREEHATDSPYLKMAIQTVLVRYMDQWESAKHSDERQELLLSAMSREIAQRARHMEHLAEQTYNLSWESRL